MTQDRYSRQSLYNPADQTEPAKLAGARIAIVGLGGLGSQVADKLARLGIGYLRLIDHDQVELSNLHRTALYTEQDVNQAKCLALAEHLRAINAQIEIEPQSDCLADDNLVDLLGGVDLLIDCTDNLPARALINRFAVQNQIPWVHGAVQGWAGCAKAFLPGQACWACYNQVGSNLDKIYTSPEACHSRGSGNPAKFLSTLEHKGKSFTFLEREDKASISNNRVAPLAVAQVAIWQVDFACRVILGSEVDSRLYYADVRQGRFSKIEIKKSQNCKLCSQDW